MNRKTLMLLIFTLLSNTSFAKDKYEISQSKCKVSESKIEKINKQLRAGYSNKQGEKLKAKLRKLKDLKYSCRQKGFATK